MTNKPQHTPGPWDLRFNEPGNDVQRGIAGYSISTPAVGVAYSIHNEHDASLIAAAPDLLAACEVAWELLSRIYTDTALDGHPDLPREILAVRDRQRAAIAKARAEAS